MIAYPCVCCGHQTMAEPPGSWAICPICFWEDDVTQLRWPNLPSGANRVSLIEAQQNFRSLGACDEHGSQFVRAPEDSEAVIPGWRPIDPRRDRFEPTSLQLRPWPENRTVLYWWRNRSVAWFEGGGLNRDHPTSDHGSGPRACRLRTKAGIITAAAITCNAIRAATVAAAAPQRSGGISETPVSPTAVHPNRSTGRALHRRKPAAITTPTRQKNAVTTANPATGMASPSTTSKSIPAAPASAAPAAVAAVAPTTAKMMRLIPHPAAQAARARRTDRPGTW
ncbi:hypothetical protein JKJ07_37050 [Actinoplanes sp. LDG1-01]|uniref:Cysteine-rich CPCC domain-containing protein n=1 Tax=Paractinoplanes lichenicola TaxID=2802976 RepID=A0ABS1VZR7_9ACTN|nr:hypothetical protein [Actinoplanes lichenicola]